MSPCPIGIDARCGNCPPPSDGVTAEPRERHHRVNHPFSQPLLGPDVVHDLHVAFDGDRREVHEGAEQRTEVEDLAQDDQAQPASAGSAEFDVVELDRVRREHEERAGEIQQVLVEYQHLFPVLFGCYQGVQDESIENGSHKSNDDDSTLKIETST